MELIRERGLVAQALAPRDDPAWDGHEQVTRFHDADAGLTAYLAIHDTRLGPAVGGCRMYPYAAERDALHDALRLSRAMTCKNALLGLPFGGGKMVIVGDPARDKTPALLAALGRAIHSLSGRYVGADDVGTTVGDMEVLRGYTPHVAGQPTAAGCACPATAKGVFLAIRAAAEHELGLVSLLGVRVAVQGLGSVGMRLCAYLAQAGARLLVADTVRDRAEAAAARFGAAVLAPADILAAEAEVLSPCALGGILDSAIVPRLRCRVIAGAANNQLAGPHVADLLMRAGICYVPDYAANAGGMIDVAQEGPHYSCERSLARCEALAPLVKEILRRARHERIPPERVAAAMVDARLRGA